VSGCDDFDAIYPAWDISLSNGNEDNTTSFGSMFGNLLQFVCPDISVNTIYTQIFFYFRPRWHLHIGQSTAYILLCPTPSSPSQMLQKPAPKIDSIFWRLFSAPVFHTIFWARNFHSMHILLQYAPGMKISGSENKHAESDEDEEFVVCNFAVMKM